MSEQKNAVLKLSEENNPMNAMFINACMNKSVLKVDTNFELTNNTKIEQGGFGSVYPYSDNMAIKTITGSDYKTMLREIKMADYVSISGNKHIIKTWGCIVHGLDNNKGILMELGGNDLFKHIMEVLAIQPGIGLSGNILTSFITDLVQGLSFLHANGIYHCDMKLENILHTKEGLKICDFGLAHHDEWVFKQKNGRDIKYGSLLPVGGIVPLFGTHAYFPSRNIARETPKLRDEWALGIIIFILSYGTFLYSKPGEVETKIETILKTAKTDDMYYSHQVGCHPRKDVEVILKLLIRETPTDIHTFARRWGIR